MPPQPYDNSLGPPRLFQQQDFKASYDDLLDENATPFTPNANHQTYTVDAMGGHRHGPSLPQSYTSSSHFSAKKSEDFSQDTSHGTYPPNFVGKEVNPTGFWRKILPESLACRLYVLTVLIETAIDLAIEGELLLRIKKADGGPETKTMPVYLSIFVLAHVFQFVMAVDAVYARNTLQFILLTIFNALFLIYAVIQIGEVKTAMAIIGAKTSQPKVPINALITIIPIVIGVAEIAYIALGWKIYNEFGWKVYKFLGADRQRKKMYASYQVYECLIKFDVFFWAGFSVQFLWLVLSNTDWEYYVTIAALPLSLVLLVEGHLAARHESKMMMLTFMSGCVGAMVYFIYKLIKVMLHIDDDPFRLVWKSLTIFSAIAIVLLLVTFVFSIIVYRNFGRGLKEALARKGVHQHGRYTSQHHGRVTSTHLNRMTIE